VQINAAGNMARARKKRRNLQSEMRGTEFMEVS
jgi:hypothetical protein